MRKKTFYKYQDNGYFSFRNQGAKKPIHDRASSFQTTILIHCTYTAPGQHVWQLIAETVS